MVSSSVQNYAGTWGQSQEVFCYIFFNYVVVRHSEINYSLPQCLCAYYYYYILDGKCLSEKQGKFLYHVTV